MGSTERSTRTDSGVAKQDNNLTVQGLVPGAVLRALRTELGLTQAELAEALGVDVNTVQGWESGRRPLTSVRVEVFQRVRRRLQLLGADLDKLAVLDHAVTADYLLSEIAEAPPPGAHPLATQVTDRTLTDLLAWPLTGKPPRILRNGSSARLLLPAGQRDVLAAQLRIAAEQAKDAESGPLLRRQVYYLLAQHEASVEWLDDMGRREQKETRDLREWTPQWVAARSLAVSRSVAGDPEPLDRFIHEGLANDSTQLANLTYWAYWVGEIPALWTSDLTMTTPDQGKWRGDVLLRALAVNLDPNVPYRDLAAHAIHALLPLRRDLADDPELADLLRTRIARMLDQPETLSSSARARLDQVLYTVRR
jgi:transcriptional regulator with XRE-family HTH domain